MVKVRELSSTFNCVPYYSGFNALITLLKNFKAKSYCEKHELKCILIFLNITCIYSKCFCCENTLINLPSN